MIFFTNPAKSYINEKTTDRITHHPDYKWITCLNFCTGYSSTRPRQVGRETPDAGTERKTDSQELLGGQPDQAAVVGSLMGGLGYKQI